MNAKQLLTLLLVLICTHGSAKLQVRARFLSAENGLGSNYVRGIVQDPRGYIWMGATNGLIRYDGYSAELLTPGDTPNRRLMKDSRVQLIQLYQDRYILLRLRGQKYSCYDTQTDQFVEFPGDYEKVFHPKDQTRRDNRGNRIETTMEGELRLTNGQTKAVIHLSGLYSKELVRLNGNPRYKVVTDRDGIVWVSTYGNGLFAHDPKTGETTHFFKTMTNTAPIQTNYLLNVFEDKAGNIWVCQENMGVACISKQQIDTEAVFFTTAEQTDHTNSIHLLTKTGGTIYVGNRYNGLKLADGNLRFKETVTKYNDDIVAVCTDRNGTLWAGTRNSGVYAGAHNYRSQPGDATSLTASKVSDILCDPQGRIWISFFNGGVDLAEADGEGGYRFRHFFTGKQAISNPRQLLSDHHGYIWLSSNGGLYTFHPDRLMADPKAYQHILLNQKDPQLDETHCLIESSDHRILAGLVDIGLAVLDNSKAGAPSLLKIYNMADGLPNNSVQQLVEDSQGNIWIGTDHGLARYNSQSHSTISLLPATTPLGNMFIENAVCQLDDGRLAFGSRHGITVVNPQSISIAESPFKLRITNIDINGTPLATAPDGSPSGPTLSARLAQQQELRLSYNQNSLTFYFSDFEYAKEKGSKYSYRLQGYDRDWSSLSDINFATYKNLPPGRYTMQVRSLNANGEWDKDTVSQVVVIRPPFWATWWAYLIYIGVIAVIGWTFYRHFRRVNDLRNRIRVEEQLTEYKMQFFTNISHEFRTPLTIIRGAMERIQANRQLPGDMKQPVSSMQKSVDRLLRLINQLLTFSKMHDNKLRLAVEETDVVAFMRNIYSTFREMAENKHISYQFTTTDQSYLMYVDREFLDKIAYNLISNAFKYTPAGRSITVALKMSNDMLLSVTDTGLGVPKDKQQALFERFNQSVFAKDSIGIGLHLTNELVRVHHGTIRFEQNPEGGSIFTVTLPTDKAVYQEQDFLQPSPIALHESPSTHHESPSTLHGYRELAPEPMNDVRVLVVEDDTDICEFIKGELGRYFVIDTANDGEEALRRIQERRPDLIISDVMMPVMNGFELTRHIRADQALAEIPVILLTALTDENKQVKGLDCGADAYITKPFSMGVLLARCTQLIGQRRQLRTTYAKEVVSKPETPAIIVDEQEKRLQAQLDMWLANHLSDTDLNIDTFAQKMGYGRTTFYKKVKKLTGKTPNDYIRSLRMERAAELLKDDTKTIAQIAYQVGFDDPYYFSKTFKQYFGITASQYRKGEPPKA